MIYKTILAIVTEGKIKLIKNLTKNNTIMIQNNNSVKPRSRLAQATDFYTIYKNRQN